MSQSTRSKVASHGKHQVDSDSEDTINLQNEKDLSMQTSHVNSSYKPSQSTPVTKTGSNILDHQYGSVVIPGSV